MRLENPVCSKCILIKNMNKKTITEVLQYWFKNEQSAQREDEWMKFKWICKQAQNNLDCDG